MENYEYARLAARTHKLIYISKMGYYKYAGGVWKHLKEYDVINLIINAAGSDALGFPMRWYKAEAVYRELKPFCRKEAAFNKAPVFNFLNGTLELDTGTFREARAKDYCTQQAHYDYDPHAKAPGWEKFVSEIMLKDEQKIKLLQETAGYVLFSDCSLQKFFFFSGKAYNGAKTFLDVLEAVVMGADRLFPHSLTANELATSINIRELKEPRLRIALYSSFMNRSNYSTSFGSEKSKSVFKHLVNGDAIDGHLAHEPYVPFTSRAKIFWKNNIFIPPKDVTQDLLTHMVYVAFNAVFVNDPNPNNPLEFKSDTDMKEKLLPELPGIFNWVYEGYKRLKREGKFSVTEEHRRMIKKFKVMNNPAAEFVKDEIINNTSWRNEPRISRSAMYERYTAWCETSGVKNTLSQKEFTPIVREQLLKARLLKREYISHGEKGFELDPGKYR